MKDPGKSSLNWKRISRNFLAYALGIGLGTLLVWALWLRNRDIPKFWPVGMVKESILKSTIENNETNTCYLNCLGLNDSTLRVSLSKGDLTMPPVRRKPYPVYRISPASTTGEKTRMYIEVKDSTYNIFRVEDLPGTTRNHVCDCKQVSF